MLHRELCHVQAELVRLRIEVPPRVVLGRGMIVVPAIVTVHQAAEILSDQRTTPESKALPQVRSPVSEQVFVPSRFLQATTPGRCGHTYSESSKSGLQVFRDYASTETFLMLTRHAAASPIENLYRSD
jgi:hypothetical protein